jgi:hypothetical protein
VGSGSWTVIQDSGATGTSWGKITWNTEPIGVVPEGASIVVEIRAADTQPALQTLNYVTVSSGVAFNTTGRYLQVRAILTANTSGATPVLSNITIQSTSLADFKPNLDSDTFTAPRGQQTTIRVTINPLNGFTQPVQFSVNGLPAGIGWQFSPSTVTPQGGPVSTNLILSVPLSTTGKNRSNTLPWTTASLVSAGCLLGAGLRRHRKLAILFLLAVLVSLGFMSIGCSGGFSVPYTAPSSLVTVTGTSGQLQHSVSFTLNVK